MTWLPPLPNLPTLFPDETLYSWAGYVHASNTNTDVRETSRQLYGAPYAALLHDFPSHLDMLGKNLEHLLGQSRDLALRHTLLGYFMPALPQFLSSEILTGVTNGAESHLKFKLGIPASRVGGHHPLKGCLQCFDDDEKHKGRAYWRVSHQYPSTFVCQRHRSKLVIAWDPTTPVHRRGWTLPRMGLHRQWVELADFPEEKFLVLEKLAHYSAMWGALQPSSLSQQGLAYTYQAALRTRELATKTGSLRLASLTTKVRSHFAGLEELPGLQVLRSISIDWPGLVGSLARSSPRSGHPLKHLLMITMLFDSWADFLNTYKEQQNRKCAEQDTLPSDANCADDERERFRVFVLDQGFSVTAAAAAVGVTTSTGVRWAKILNIPFTPRTKTLTPQTLNNVRALLRQGLDKAEVEKRGAISMISLNRLLSSEPDVAEARRIALTAAALKTNREHFAAAVNEHPGWSINQLRALPKNGYAWLYRHDRAWLLEHMPGIWEQNN